MHPLRCRPRALIVRCGQPKGEIIVTHVEVADAGPDGENQEAGEAKGTAYVTSGSMLDGLKEQLAPKGCSWTGLNQEFGTAGNITAIKEVSPARTGAPPTARRACALRGRA